MVTQLWSWMWSGMSWILDLQQLVFGFVFSGSPGLAVLKATLLLLPAAVLIVSMWATMTSALHPAVPLRPGLLPHRAADVVVGCRPDGLVLLGGHGPFLFVSPAGSAA